MGMPVVTVATGGLPIVESTNGFGTPVTEAASGRGVAVTKVVGKPGLPVVFVTEAGVVVPPVTYATLDGTPSNVTLSNGNLTATHTNATTNAGARSTAAKTSGKYYFEVTFDTLPANGDCFGIMQSAAVFSNPVTSGTNCSCAYGTGLVYSNDVVTSTNIGTLAMGNVLSAAIDFSNARAWFRKNSGNWNENVSGNPATNVGGVTIETPAAGYVPFVGFTTVASVKVTVNFGALPFVNTVPSGFSGWPA